MERSKNVTYNAKHHRVMRLADGLSFAHSLMFSTAYRERSYVLDSCRERSNVLDCMQRTLKCSRLHAENAHMFSTACREPSYHILYFVYYNVFYSWTKTSYSILGLVQLVYSILGLVQLVYSILGLVQLVYSIVGLSHRILNSVN